MSTVTRGAHFDEEFVPRDMKTRIFNFVDDQDCFAKQEYEIDTKVICHQLLATNKTMCFFFTIYMFSL